MKKQNLAKIEACIASSDASTKLIENYYLPLAENALQVDRSLYHRLSAEPIQEIIRQMPPNWIESLYSILVAYECFKANGFFEKHPELEAKAGKDFHIQLLCKAFHEKPWKYTFCRMVKAKGDDLFEMRDELTGEKFELYSKSVRAMIDERGDSFLFGFLRFWNGHCWQTYFGLFYFMAFDFRDLFSFATVLDPEFRDVSDIDRVIDKHLLDFLLLFYFAEAPFITHHKQELRFIQSTHICNELPLEALEKDFEIHKKQGVYRLQLRPCPDQMQVAEVYWSPKTSELILESSAKDLDTQLRKILRKNEIAISQKPNLDMSISMDAAISVILQKNPHSQYAKKFQESGSELPNKTLEPINGFMELLVKKINRKQPYSLQDLAKQMGIELSMARFLEKGLLDQINRVN